MVVLRDRRGRPSFRRPLRWELLEDRCLLSADLSLSADVETVEALREATVPIDSIVVTELMADNENGLEDEDGERSDWIELYNSATESLELTGWYLTDDPGVPEKWRFPETVVGGGEFLIVFASGKDRREPTAPLHANFQLASSGEYVGLIAPDASTVVWEIRPGFPRQSADVAYGVAFAGGVVLQERVGYLADPTPGQANGPVVYEGVVADVEVSVPRGIHSVPFDVTLSSSTPGASIVFTVDGSLPSPANGTRIDAAAGDAAPEATVHAAKTGMLRAIAVREGWIGSRVVTHTYIFPSDVAAQDYVSAIESGLPSFWGDVAADYGLDPKIVGPDDLFGGVYADGLADALRTVPSLSLVMNRDDMFGAERGLYLHPEERGETWERPTSVELIHPDGVEGFQIDAGIRIFGGASRNNSFTRKKSFRLAFRGTYGESKLIYPLFGEGAAERFDSLVLRGGFNDSWSSGPGAQHIRDEWVRITQREMGWNSPHGIYVHLYINGMYWGLYNFVERPDELFASTYSGGEEADWDVLNHNGRLAGDFSARVDLVRWTMEVASPDPARSNAALLRLMGRNADGSANPDFEKILNVENYIDYMLLNLFAGNRDWPHTNYYLARRRGGESDGFQFYSWDAEASLGLGLPIDEAVAADVTGVSTGIAGEYSRLRTNAEFRQMFADRVQKHLFNGGALSVDPHDPAWDPADPQRNLPAARYAALADQVELALVGGIGPLGRRARPDGAGDAGRLGGGKGRSVRRLFSSTLAGGLGPTGRRGTLPGPGRPGVEPPRGRRSLKALNLASTVRARSTTRSTVRIRG